jgi:hypothetical protein
MLQEELTSESITKNEMGIKDFSLLSAPGVLGNYLECELTHIFLVERKTHSCYHYFALFSYEEFLEKDKSLRDISLTDKLIRINNNYSLGIKKIRLSLSESKDMFNLWGV